MKRTSIFSREYEKKIRKKRFTILFIVLIFSFSIVYYIINFSQFNNYVKNIYYSILIRDYDRDIKNQENLNEESKDVSLIENNEIKNKHSDGEFEIENLDYLKHEVELTNGEKFNILYKKGDKVEYLDLQSELSESYIVDVSPNKSRILIENLNTQDVYMIDENFNLLKLDPEFFYSNSAGSRFYKNDILNTYGNYSWYKNARFLNDSTVIYVSNLPWFGKDEEYIWKTDVEDINDIKHFMTTVGGVNISFQELTEEGIKVNINNEIKLLTFSFVLN